jgi:glycosyltransferase involved in cell wall biosynthesis
MQTPLDRPFLSLILPVLDEAATLAVQLAALQELRTRATELIVVDGGSGDRTVELARPAVDRLLDAPRGRATQMNAGAEALAGARFCSFCMPTRRCRRRPTT